MPYRVDWLEGNTVKAFGFSNGVVAWKNYVEGVANACDEVCIYEFAGGRDSAVLLARHNLKGLTKHGTETVESKKEAIRRGAAQAFGTEGG